MTVKKQGLDISGDTLKLDGKDFRILSGAIHYFRVLPEYWKDRLIKLKQMGLNTVETYLCWFYHERQEGKFNFRGRLDFVKFIKTAEKLGLKVILRPGPYICSEIEFGGLPWWLLKYDMCLRTSDCAYIKYVKRYLDIICEKIRPLLYENGGSVIAVQIENEYGAYGNDKEYLKKIKQIYLNNGIKTTFFTSDGITEYMLKNGATEDAWMTSNFRLDAEKHLNLQKKCCSGNPLMVMEYWNGREFNYEYDGKKRDVKPIADCLGDILKLGSSFNLYMFHGGTNFGFTNGSNYDMGFFGANTTSYDVDAPLNEYGQATEKYYAEQKVIYEYLNLPLPKKLPDVVTKNYGEAKIIGAFDFFSKAQRSASIKNLIPLTMEQVDQGYGYIMYTTYINGTGEIGRLLFKVHDFAMVYVNGKFMGEVRRDREDETIIEFSAENNARVDIFVENIGRIKFGKELIDRKGIIGYVTYMDMVLFNWEIKRFPFERVPNNNNAAVAEIDKPSLTFAEIDIDEKQDTFIKLDGFYRGFVFINGFNLGRHWHVGPQKTLYVPKYLLKKGKNNINVFDVKDMGIKKSITLTDTHELFD